MSFLSLLVVALVANACGAASFDGRIPDLAEDLSRERLWSQRSAFGINDGKSLARHQHDLIVDKVARLDRKLDRAWQGLSQTDIRKRQRRIRDAWIAAIGGFPERTPLNPSITGRIQRHGYAVEKVFIESRPKHYLTAHLYLPDDPKFKPPYACVVVPCGHSQTGKSAFPYQRMGVVMASSGLAAIVYDPVDQGERDQTWVQGKRMFGSSGHGRINLRAELIGWNTAQFRIFDGFRVFDYLETRRDIDAGRLAVAGMSGGGTLSSYLMALEPRVRAAAPAGYLTSLRDTVRFSGPQDAEQNIYGQLRFGLNHVAIMVLRAPSPELICHTSADFFETPGTEESLEWAKDVYEVFGAAKALSNSYSYGVHAWYESQKRKDVCWFQRWLQEDLEVWPPESRALERKDVGLVFSEIEIPFRNPEDPVQRVAPQGLTSAIPDSRTVYDIIRAEAHEIVKGRDKLTDEDIRRVTGIRPIEKIGFAAVGERDRTRTDGILSHDAILATDDGVMLPTVTFTPPNVRGRPVLYVSDALELAAEAESVGGLVAEGRIVTVLSPRLCGESAVCYPRWMQDRSAASRFATWAMYWLGESMVGARAEDVTVAARWLSERTKSRVEVIARGHCAVPTVHAWRLARQLFVARPRLVSPPPSWTAVIEDCAVEIANEDTVYNAYRHYDWVDL